MKAYCILLMLVGVTIGAQYKSNYSYRKVPYQRNTESNSPYYEGESHDQYQGGLEVNSGDDYYEYDDPSPSQDYVDREPSRHYYDTF